MNLYHDKLTEDGLERLGFVKVDLGPKHYPREVWRVKMLYYSFVIQVTLGDYPKDNPNSGIVSIHSPEQWASGIPKYLCKKVNWTSRDHKRAANYKIKMKEWTQPVAWHVNTFDRIHKVISALTGVL